MYQVIIKNKFYVKHIGGFSSFDGEIFLLEFEATTEKEEAKSFYNKITACDVAEQVGGRVIEYISKSLE